MTAAERIGSTLGGRREGRDWRCECPLHGGHSLVVADGREGRLLVKCWAGCDPRDILAELHRRGLLNGDARVTTPPNPEQIEHRRSAKARDRRQRIANALDLWGECYPAYGTLVTTYWRSRGLAEPIPPTIRMHGMMRHGESGSRRPSMVALVEHVDHGPVGVHITYLAIDGSTKATVVPVKRSLGPVGGGAVQLAPAGKLLMVAEGIETAASAAQACPKPVWAALSTSGLLALVLPPVVSEVIILADNDANGAGGRAARSAALRWTAEGRNVRIAIPPEPGMDFNDVLLGRSHRSVAEVSSVAA